MSAAETISLEGSGPQSVAARGGRRRGWLLGLGMVVAVAGGTGPLAAASTTEGPSIVFVLRHAEKVLDGSRDPALSEEGQARARRVATLLEPARITHVWSSDYRRTRDTAAPIAAAAGVEVRLYDVRDLAGLVDALLATTGRHVVVGHSDTTPEVVRRLGGDPGPPIEEGTEYGRLYVLIRGAEGEPTVVRVSTDR